MSHWLSLVLCCNILCGRGLGIEHHWGVTVQEREDISHDTWLQRMQDWTARDLLMASRRDRERRQRALILAYIAENSTNNHHALQAPSETNPEQDHTQSET